MNNNLSDGLKTGAILSIWLILLLGLLGMSMWLGDIRKGIASTNQKLDQIIEIIRDPRLRN